MQAPSSPLPRWLLRFHPYAVGISLGEVMFWMCVCGFFAYWVHYWVEVFPHTIARLRTSSKENIYIEHTARICGDITVFFASFVMLPVSRTGIWVDVFGIPYERAIKYHRIFGGLTYAMVTVHACVFWGKWWTEGNLGNNMFTFNNLWLSPKRNLINEFTIPIAETAWALLTLSVIVAVFFRRRTYTAFQYFHQAAGIFFYIAAIMHAWGFW